MSRLLNVYRRLFAQCNARLPDPQEEIEYLHGVLATLDRKASALMIFDAILIAAAAFLLAHQNAAAQLLYWPTVVAASLLVLLFAVLLGLFVIRASWSFLGRAALTAAPIDFSPEISALGNAVDRRTRCYQMAWWLSLAAIVLFLAAFALPLLTAPGEL